MNLMDVFGFIQDDRPRIPIQVAVNCKECGAYYTTIVTMVTEHNVIIDGYWPNCLDMEDTEEVERCACCEEPADLYDLIKREYLC